MVKNSSWQEADQLAICNCGRGVEVGATVRHQNHSATLPPPIVTENNAKYEFLILPLFYQSHFSRKKLSP